MMSDKHGAVLNFSSNHNTYYSAYQYVTKSDPYFCTSPGHSNLTDAGPPRPSQCIKAYRESSRKRAAERSTAKSTNSKSRKKEKLNNDEVYQILVDQDLKTVDELYAYAARQAKEGKRDLHSFILGRRRKSIEELIENTWHLKEAEVQVERAARTRMSILREAFHGACVSGCNRLWYQSAVEVLESNYFHPVRFGSSVRELLQKGCGKFRNLMFIGPANCGKTFLLQPLVSIFKCFINPSNDKYAWVGAEKSEIIFMNDFRWEPTMIS